MSNYMKEDVFLRLPILYYTICVHIEHLLSKQFNCHVLMQRSKRRLIGRPIADAINFIRY